MNNFVQRTLSSVVYAGSIILLTICSEGYFGLMFCAVLAAIMLWAVWEFHHLMGSSRFNTIWSMLTALIVYGGVVVYIMKPFPTESSVLAILFGWAVLMLYVGLIVQLWLKREHPVQEWGNNLISIYMVAMPFILMPLILSYNKWVLLALFVIIWLNDAGAYCVGMLTAKLPGGNHKMFPRVSPKKSWEWLIGGVAFAILTGYIFSLCEPIIPTWQWLVYAAVIAVSGNLGDLMESLMKRSIGVKDSGFFLPGHGGVLDRFDSLLLATPCAVLLLALFL